MISLHERQAAYERERDTRGVTVEEWETAQGLPPFSVYPAARFATGPSDDGWFMYASQMVRTKIGRPRTANTAPSLREAWRLAAAKYYAKKKAAA